MDPYEANEIDLTTFNPVLASYGPKGIYAAAALITEDNIGQIALQLERDVLYSDSDMLSKNPYVRILADRHTEEPIELTIKPGFWIVLIWEEIHIFKDGLFQKTFQIDISTEPEKGLTEEELQERLAAVSKHIAEPAIPRVGPDYHAGSLYKSEGQEPGFYERTTPQKIIEKFGDRMQQYINSGTDSEKTVIVPSAGELGKQLTDSVGNLYPEGEGPLVDESREPGELQD